MVYSITKSTAELYKLRHPSGLYWADITLDYEGKQGRIQIASDFGSWQNFWGGAGPDFKTFLAKISKGYAADKFGAGRHFDISRNIEAMRKYLEESDIEKSVKKGCKRELKSIEEEACSEHHFYSELQHTEYLSSIFCFGDWDFIHSIDPGFGRFWETVWPEFLAFLKSEGDAIQR